MRGASSSRRSRSTGPWRGRTSRQLRRVAEGLEAEVIYSGGVGDLDHLRALAELGLPNLAGAMVGRALYEGRFTVAEAQLALEG